MPSHCQAAAPVFPGASRLSEVFLRGQCWDGHHLTSLLVIWTQRLSVPSTSLPMTSSCVVTCWSSTWFSGRFTCFCYGRWDWMILKALSHPNHSMALCSKGWNPKLLHFETCRSNCFAMIILKGDNVLHRLTLWTEFVSDPCIRFWVEKLTKFTMVVFSELVSLTISLKYSFSVFSLWPKIRQDKWDGAFSSYFPQTWRRSGAWRFR